MRQFINNLPTEMQPCFAVWPITSAPIRSLFSVKWICSDLKSSTPPPCLTNISDLFSSFSSSPLSKSSKLSSSSSTPSSSHSTTVFAPPNLERPLFAASKSEFYIFISALNWKYPESMCQCFLPFFFFFLTLKTLSVVSTCFLNK